MPLTSNSQYLLFWYIAETVPPQLEEQLNAAMAGQATAVNPTPYQYPPQYPAELTLAERLKLEPELHEPVHHENTAVDSEEALYESYLLPIKEAIEKLKGTVQEDVVRSGWDAICLRHNMEYRASRNTFPI